MSNINFGTLRPQVQEIGSRFGKILHIVKKRVTQNLERFRDHVSPKDVNLRGVFSNDFDDPHSSVDDFNTPSSEKNTLLFVGLHSSEKPKQNIGIFRGLQDAWKRLRGRKVHHITKQQIKSME